MASMCIQLWNRCPGTSYKVQHTHTHTNNKNRSICSLSFEIKWDVQEFLKTVYSTLNFTSQIGLNTPLQQSYIRDCGEKKNRGRTRELQLIHCFELAMKLVTGQFTSLTICTSLSHACITILSFFFHFVHASKPSCSHAPKPLSYMLKNLCVPFFFSVCFGCNSCLGFIYSYKIWRITFNIFKGLC